MQSYQWTQSFRLLHEKAELQYRKGNREPESYFSDSEKAELTSIGLRPGHLYDFAEDFVGSGEPDWSTSLLISAVRRDYFLYIQGGEVSVDLKVVRTQDLPERKAEMEGIPWLPRILTKARAFLEGSLCPEVMYFCGGDRNFLRTHDLHPADFLRAVWGAGARDEKVLAFVRGAPPC